MNLSEFIKTQNNDKINPFIIAECGVNHEGDYSKAKLMIDQAKSAGANAVKFQSYKASKLAVKDSPTYWDHNKEKSNTQYELFKKHDSFGKKEFERLKKYCDKKNIEFLSTPFDIESADYLNDLVNVFKISSSDITNKPFIEYIAKFKKPIILSTGASTLKEVYRTVRWIEEFGNDIALLHCVLQYPTNRENANLGSIRKLQEQFSNYLIGYSDHTVGIRACVDSILLGAKIIEKHFTWCRAIPGNDHYHSADKQDLEHIISMIENIKDIYGESEVKCLKCEEKARLNARRSIMAKKQIKKGERLTNDNLTWKRPGTGICPSEIENVLGKVAKIIIKKDSLICYNEIESINNG